MPFAFRRSARRLAASRRGLQMVIAAQPVPAGVLAAPSGGEVGSLAQPFTPQPGPPPAPVGSQVGGGGLSGFGATPNTYRVSPTDPDAAGLIARNPPGMYSVTSAADAAPHLAQLAAEGNPTTAAGVDAQRQAADPYFAALANAQKKGLIKLTPVAP